MFWKFGFHNASSIDTLLDKDDVAIEAILDEDDLLQECKAQNTRLIDYFQKMDVLQRLLRYVTGEIEGDSKGRFKYPYVATEVLCSEIWSIVETCINNSEVLLVPFWETVLDKSPEEMKTQNVMASQFAKINAVFLGKKPTEMFRFIQSQPAVVDRLLRHIETPAFVDLLFRLIQLDEYAPGTGVLEWLSQERLIPRLVDLLSPTKPATMHSVVSELIKGIISMSAPSPGSGLSEGLQNGPASNLFARQLAQRGNVTKLVEFMLDDTFFELHNEPQPAGDRLSPKPPPGMEILTDDLPAGPPTPTIPNRYTATSSGINSISVITELIRKNNSDYFEPYLFHTLRKKIIEVQQHLHTQDEDGRNTLEQAMQEMVNKMGVVHLGSLLEIMSERLDRFQRLLQHPRSQGGPILTTLGELMPLTFERFRICELYAELLHCSNMSLLNRSSEFDGLYDSQGRLWGGLAALEQLARVIAIGTGNDEQDRMDAESADIEPAQELPVSRAYSVSSPSLESDEDDDDAMSDEEPSSSDDDVMEEITINGDQSSPFTEDEQILEGPSAFVTPSFNTMEGGITHSQEPSSSDGPSSQRNRIAQRTSSRNSKSQSRKTEPPTQSIGDQFKRRFKECNVLSTLLDLFFQFPWNNFLHSVVYDVIHQIITGRMDTGYNRELTISLFRDSKLMHRIVEGQRRNDFENSKPKGVRLGYMGHLTLMSEDVIGALGHYPPDLRQVLAQCAPQPDWDEYVRGRYHETKKKDSSLLGGGKPAIIAGTGPLASRWKVDENESIPQSIAAKAPPLLGINDPPQPIGEFHRTSRVAREQSADFGPAPIAADIDAPQITNYLTEQMSSGVMSDTSDDDDDDSGWLTHSKFDIGPPPISARNHSGMRRPLDPTGFDDSFDPNGSTNSSPFDTGMVDDEDAFGPFSDAAASSSDPFSFAIQDDDAEDVSFDGFGDFGDFQTADGELTPTAGSWTLASSASISSGSDDAELDDCTQESTERPQTKSGDNLTS